MFDMNSTTYTNNNMKYVFDLGIAKSQSIPVYMPMTVENEGVSNTIFDKVYSTSYSITLKPAYIPKTTTEPNYYYMSYIYFNVTNAFHDTYVNKIRDIHNDITLTIYNDPVADTINVKDANIYKDYALIDNDLAPNNKLNPLFFNENYIQPDVNKADIATVYKQLNTDSGTGGSNHSIHYNIKNGSIFPCWTYSNQYSKYYDYNFYKNWIFNYRFKDYMTLQFTRDLSIPPTTLPDNCIYISFFHIINKITYYLVNPTATDTITFTTDILLATPFKQITYTGLSNASKFITKDGTKILGVDAISSGYQADLKLFLCDAKYEPVELDTNTISGFNNKMALHNVKRPWFIFDSQSNIYMRNSGYANQDNTVGESAISVGFTSLYGAGNYAPYLIIDTTAKTIKLDSALHKVPLDPNPSANETKLNTSSITAATNAAKFETIPAKIDVGTFSTTYTITDLYTLKQGNTTIYGFIHPSSNPAYCKLISYPSPSPITLATASSVLNTIDDTIYKYDGQNTLKYSILNPDVCPDIKKLNGDTGFVLSKFTIPDETLAANYTTDSKTWTLPNKSTIPATKLFKKFVKNDNPTIYIFLTTDNEYLLYDLVSSGLKLVPVTSTNINKRYVNTANGKFIYYENHVRFLQDTSDENQYYLKNIPLEDNIRSVSLSFTEFVPTTTTTTTAPPTESSTTTTTTTAPPTESSTTTTAPPTESSTTTTAPPTEPSTTTTTTVPVTTTTTTKYITTTTTPSPIDMGTYMRVAPGSIVFPVIQ